MNVAFAIFTYLKTDAFSLCQFTNSLIIDILSGG